MLSLSQIEHKWTKKKPKTMMLLSSSHQQFSLLIPLKVLILLLLVNKLMGSKWSNNNNNDEASSSSLPSSCSTIEECAIDVVLRSIVNETIVNKSTNATFCNIYASPCWAVKGIQESTSALLAARVLSKNGNSSIAWNVIHSIFDAQGANGFLPRYRFSPLSLPSRSLKSDNVTNDDTFYIPNTAFPYSSLFQNFTTAGNYSINYDSYRPILNNARKAGISSSIPLAAVPFHSTIILDIFFLSSQNDNDLQQLEFFFSKLYQWHSFLYNYRNNVDVDDDPLQINDKNYIAILHPWESTIPMHSPLWKYVLKPVMENMTRSNWTSPFPIPNRVKSAIDYPGDDTYNAFLYLLQCNNNLQSTKPFNNSISQNSSTHTIVRPNKSCFSMMDIGFSAALAKSNLSLLQIAQILTDKRSGRTITTQEWDTMNMWLSQSRNALEENSWSNEHQSFVSQLSLRQTLRTSPVASTTITKSFTPVTKLYEHNSTQAKEIPIPVSDNFLVFYGIKISNRTHTDSMIFHLLQEDGCFSFNIGNYPIFPTGGVCPLAPIIGRKDSLALLSPTLNYWVSKGLIFNGENGLGHYLMNSTLNLVCQLPNSIGNDDGRSNSSDILTKCEFNSTFSQFYNGYSGKPALVQLLTESISVGNGHSVEPNTCESEWTESASVVYDIIRPDKNFTYTIAPPIASGWIFLFMTIELALTLIVGVGCFLFSLQLSRRLETDFEDGEAFVRMMHGDQSPNLEDLYGDSCRSKYENDRLIAGNGDVNMSYAEIFPNVMGYERSK